ncbi:MAG: ribonuclease D [Alphaproteobacteria bacterium]|nr:ribonuclease D [Alphaproteobacteria bacterium]
MQLIENTTELNNLISRLAEQKFVCIDLEFLREHTYFAKLCLIQIASAEEAAVIDPLAPDLDLSAFFDLMQNPNVTKVFHSGRQDIEIIYNISGKIPVPLYDTQIAAQAAGFGESVSYENLVVNILHIELDKSSRLSDWSRRPLSENQLNYALSDVTHLVNLYQYLTEWLASHNRSDWIKEDLENLSNEALYKVEPYEIWKKMRHRSHSPLFLTVLRELAAWREQRAIDKNIPRHSFIKDDILINICMARPQTKEDLKAIRGIRPDLAQGKIGDEIIAVMEYINTLPKEAYVTPPPVKDFSGTDTALMELLKLLQKSVAQEQKITPHLICSEDDLKLFCQFQDDEVSFTKGWRYEIFGTFAAKLRDGKTAVAYNPKHHFLKFIDVSE